MADNIKFNLMYEKYLLGELSSTEKEIIENNPSAMKEIKNLTEDNKDFFKKFDIDKLVSETDNRVKSSTKILSFPKKVASVLAVAACLIITLNFFPKLTGTPKEEIYLKGAQRINVYLKTDDSVEKLKNLDSVTENNQLQITYHTKNAYGLIFSIDGLNNITYHHPENIHTPTNMDIGKEVSLATSYTLDNAPYFEKFYLITTEDSFDINLVKEAISRIKISDGKISKDIKLPSKYRVNTITLLKD